MKKKIIALLMVCATLVFGLIQPASAIEPLELETIDMGNDLDRYSSMISPDHIYPLYL